MPENIDSITEALIRNPIQFKLAMAKYFLTKMPSKPPKQNTIEHIRLETNAEMFLFFASGVVEILKRNINDTFEIFDKENVFYIHGLRKNLADHGRQKKAKQYIANYFTTPHITKSKINISKSTLWRLQSLRNQAMHGNVINISNHMLLFSYTIREGKKSYKFEQKTQNPRRYFGQIHAGLTRFSAEITKVLS